MKVAAVLPLSLPNPAMGLPPVSLPSLPISGLAPLPVVPCSAMQPPAIVGGSVQMQMPQQVLAGPPSVGPAAFLDPSQTPPPRPNQALTLPPASAHLRPVVPAVAAAAQLPADARVGLSQLPQQGHPVAFQRQQPQPQKQVIGTLKSAVPASDGGWHSMVTPSVQDSSTIKLM